MAVAIAAAAPGPAPAQEASQEAPQPGAGMRAPRPDAAGRGSDPAAPGPGGAAQEARTAVPEEGPAPGAATRPRRGAPEAAPSEPGEGAEADAGTAPDTGAEAFARQEFEAARALWSAEAEAGSAAAAMGLALLADLGLGQARDPARARAWYGRAAEGGHAEAQFSYALLLSEDEEGPADVEGAALWHARAAANGHARAALALGRLYAAGEGAPRNLDLARHWMGAAADALPEAAHAGAALDAPALAERALEAPRPLAGALVTGPEGARAELVWSAPPGPQGAPFLVEIIGLAGAGEAAGRTLAAIETHASAVAPMLEPALAPGSRPLAWRVSRLAREGGAHRYAASPWQALGTAGSGALPEGRVAIRHGARDAAAARLAREVAQALGAAGLWVRVEPAPEAPRESAVRHAYAQDRDLAARLAAFLPVLAAADAAPAPDLDAPPGEVEIRLRGGPDGGPDGGDAWGGLYPAPASQTSIVPGAGSGR